MAIVETPGRKIRFTDPASIRETLAAVGIDYERWDADEARVAPDSDEAAILEAYAPEIERLMLAGGYVAADVINIVPSTTGLEEMLGRFSREHWHDEDEIRFIVKGRGLFHIAPPGADVLSVEMEAGDLIRVPRGTLHWFNLCGERTVRAIRLFQDPAGWTPHYTESGIDSKYQPICFGALAAPDRHADDQSDNT